MKYLLSLLITWVISIGTLMALDHRLELTATPYEYTGNIYKDSSEQSDVRSSIDALYNIYPLELIEINTFAKRQNYDRNSALSNWQYGGKISCIPFSDSSRIQVFSTINLTKFEYQRELTVNSTEFQTENLIGQIVSGYSFRENINGRFGYQYSSTGYENDAIDKKKAQTFFTGLNLTFLNRISIDIESGTSWGNLQYIHKSVGAIQNAEKAYSVLTEADLRSYYFSIRLSHQLGQKTGLSQTYSKKILNDVGDSTLVYGYSSGYLSPWIDTYDGFSYQLKVKSFIVPRFILSAGIGYMEKAYIPVVERITYTDPFFGDVEITTTVRSQTRAEVSHKYFLNIKMPLANDLGILLEPELNLEFTNNNSTVNVYDFNDLSVRLGIRMTY